MNKITKTLLPALASLVTASCGNDSSSGREIIFVESIDEIAGYWRLTEESSAFNANGQTYKSNVSARSLLITAGAESRGTLKACNQPEIDILLDRNTVYQIIESPLDADGDSVQDVDEFGTPLTEELFTQLFVMNSTQSMIQPFTFSCDTQDKVDATGCTLGETESGTTRLDLLANNNFGQLTIANFETSSGPVIANPNSEALDIDCFYVGVESETDGEAIEEAIIQASNANYVIDLRFENTVVYDSVNMQFTETNIAWVETLESLVSTSSWQYLDADANAPNPAHTRVESSGTFTLAGSTTSVTADVILADGNQIEEDNAGVTSTVNYAISASADVTFELLSGQ